MKQTLSGGNIANVWWRITLALFLGHVAMGANADARPVAGQIDVQSIVSSDWPWLDDPRAGAAPSSAVALGSTGGWDGETPLGSLADGLIRYMAFDGELSIFAPTGLEGVVSFSRSTPAWTPDLRRHERNEPRYVPGSFGQGLLVEYGHTMAGRNQLSEALAAADSTDVFVPLGQAEITRAAGLEGANAVQLRTTAEDAGILIQDLEIPKSVDLTFSAYVKGIAGTRMSLVLQRDAPSASGTEPILSDWATNSIVLEGGWQRLTLNARDPKVKLASHQIPKAKRTVNLKLLLEKPGEVLLDALMLETHAGYGLRHGASTWVPGGKGRGGEIVRLAPLRDAESGTIAFWTQITGNMSWRCLLTIGDGTGWSPALRLDLRDQQTFSLVSRDKKACRKLRLPAPLQPGDWHNVAVTWEGGTRRLFLDGRELFVIRDAPSLRDAGSVIVGGVGNNFSPALRADAVFDEVACWQRALTADEVATLAARTEPLSEGIDNRLTLRDRESLSVFARDYRRRVWPLEVCNRSSKKIKRADLTWKIDDIVSGRIALPKIAAHSAVSVSVEWSPAVLLPGDYTIHFAVEGAKSSPGFSQPIEIVPARTPVDHAQVITWGGSGQKMADAGVTVAGLTGIPLPSSIDEATRSGLYSMTRISLQGKSSNPDDRMTDVAGTPHDVDQRAPEATLDREARMRETCDRLRNLPDIRFVIPNTEHLWVWGMDFRPATRTYVRDTFGLDLDRWLVTNGTKRVYGKVHPSGRLSARAGGVSIPEDGIIPLNQPFYAFHRWWHSDGPGNEIFLNDWIAERLRAAAPAIRTMAEPALRRPPVRAFRQQDIIEEWYYYGDPGVAMNVQEKLTAAARGSDSDICGMPQFLLKPGMAAPYRGIPTPDMFRETVWHCLARPLVGMTYWNLWGVLTPPKGDMTQAQIDAELKKRLGPDDTLDFKTVRGLITVKGEHSDIALKIPELADEVGRMHDAVVHPLAPLLSRWRNQPRQIAVLYSFAGDLFSEIRWPHGGGMNRAIRKLADPYDVLYDQDFEGNPDVLNSYRVLIIPQSPVLTEPAAQAIRTFIKDGGTVIVDHLFKADIQGVVRFDWRDAKSKHESLGQLAAALTARYGRPDHPQVVEGMTAAVEQRREAPGPAHEMLNCIESSIDPSIRMSAPNMHYNLLTVAGANYLMLVNDLRGPGRHYGHFGRVLEDGIAQDVTVDLKAELGAVAYELPGAERLAMIGTKDGQRLELSMPPAGGRVVMFVPRPIDRLELQLESSATVSPGDYVTLSGELLDTDGEHVPGVIPVTIEISRPDGTRDGFSRYDALVAGRGRWTFPIASNAPRGEWRFTVRELAGGHEASWTGTTEKEAVTP